MSAAKNVNANDNLAEASHENIEMPEPVEAIAPHVEPRELLRNSILFREAHEEAINFIAGHIEPCTFAQGDPIILQGERNDHVYFVRTGAVEIVSYIPTEKRVQRVALLKSGAHFAEFSVISGTNKSGSAYAYKDCELFRIHGEHFMQMLRRFPEVPQKLSRLLAELVYSFEMGADFVPYVKPDQLLDVVGSATEVLPVGQWSRLGAIPIASKGSMLYVAMRDLRNGLLADYITGRGKDLHIISYLIDENMFEEIVESVAKNKFQPRATVAAFKPAVAPSTLETLRSAPLFKDFPDDVLFQIRDNIPVRNLASGEILVRPQDAPGTIYFILSGSLQLSREVEAAKVEAALYELGRGEWVGDVEYFSQKPFLHNVRAIEDTVLIPFSADVIDQLVATPVFTVPLSQILATRLQNLNHLTGVQFYKPEVAPRFDAVRDLIPKGVMAEQHVLPLEIRDNEILLGSVSTDHASVLSLIGRYLSDYRVKIVNITDLQFKSWIMQFQTTTATDEKVAAGSTKGLNLADVSKAVVDPTHVLNEIFLRGLSLRASDIHFETFERGLIVRYRVDGELAEHAERFQPSVAKQIISRLKILAGMDIANHFTPQDGHLKTDINELTFVARASVLPVKHGETMVLRIIRQKSSIIPLNMLAPDRRSIHLLQGIARSNQGLFLVTGPTGSGKTSTLYSMVQEVNKVGLNVVTIEEPVEMEIIGCNQVEIDRKKGLDFSLVLRSVLRQDPDVIMVGEIRDAESAKIVFDAAITGHLVLSTLHTNSSLDVPARLRELGISPATLSAGLLGVLSQRLIRSICKKCESSRPMTLGEKKFVQRSVGDIQMPDVLHYGRGCQACHHTGYLDRLPVFEMWRNNLQMNNALLSGADLMDLEKIAREDHFETLFEFGIRMALIGLTTLDEVRRNLSNMAS